MKKLSFWLRSVLVLVLCSTFWVSTAHSEVMPRAQHFYGQQTAQTGSSAEQDKTAEDSKQAPISPEMRKALERNLNTDTVQQSVSDGLTTAERIAKYVHSGFVHIVPMGIDHILFVIGLFLVASSMRQLLLQVTVFTVSHSITLGLAAAGYIGLSSDIVEPLIALSIAYIAYENITNRANSKSRLWIIFAFGLLHGLGFAFVLQEFGVPSESFLTALFAFNIGVELGQLSVIAAAYVLLFYWRNKPSYRFFVQVPVSIFIGLIGVYWTIERLLL